MTSPSASGSYLWRAFVTPPGGAAHELRSVVPVPNVLQAKATYVARSHTLVVTGRAVAGGAPEPNAKVVVERQGNSTVAFGTATTRAEARAPRRAPHPSRSTQLVAAEDQAGVVGPAQTTADHARERDQHDEALLH